MIEKNSDFYLKQESDEILAEKIKKKEFAKLMILKEIAENNQSIDLNFILNLLDKFKDWWKNLAFFLRIDSKSSLNAQFSHNEQNDLNEFFNLISAKLINFYYLSVDNEVIILKKIYEIINLNSDLSELFGIFLSKAIFCDDKFFLSELPRIGFETNISSFLAYAIKIKEISRKEKFNVSPDFYANLENQDQKRISNFLESINQNKKLSILFKTIFYLKYSNFFKYALVDLDIKEKDWQKLYQMDSFWFDFLPIINKIPVDTAFIQSLLLKNIGQSQIYVEKAKEVLNLSNTNSGEKEVKDENLLAFHKDWWLCKSSEAYFLKSKESGSLLRINEHFLAKFNGKVVLLCCHTFLNDKSHIFFAGNYYAPLINDKKIIIDSFLSGKNQIQIKNLSLVLMRNVKVANLTKIEIEQISTNTDFVQIIDDYNSNKSLDLDKRLKFVVQNEEKF